MTITLETMYPQVVGNRAVKLASAYTAGTDTTISVEQVDASAIPTAPNRVTLIDKVSESEQYLVTVAYTGISDTTLTGVTVVESDITESATHVYPTGSAVFHPFTKADYDAITTNIGTLKTSIEGIKPVQYETLPTASAELAGTIVQFVGTTTTDYTNGYFYQCILDTSVTPNIYKWVAKNVQDAGSASVQSDWNQTDDTQPDYIKNKPTLEVIQVSALPTASASILGKIVQYIGTTTTTATNGYFYQCVEVTPATTPATYTWTQKNVQAGGGGSSAWSDVSGKPFSTLGDDFIVDSAEDKLHVKAVTSVSSWQTTTDDVHFPTEKLVKAGLDGKQADILTTIPGTAGQVLARNPANNALIFKDAGGSGSVEIDNVTLKKDSSGKLYTAIGGGDVITEHEELIKASIDGMFIPAGTFPEVPVNICAFTDETLRGEWSKDVRFKFTFKSDTYQSAFDATLGIITVLGVNLVGFEVTDAVFGNIKFGHIYPEGTDDVIAVVADNHIENVTMQILNFTRVDEYSSAVPMDTTYIPIDSRVLERIWTKGNQLSLVQKFGTWDEESSETACWASDTGATTTATAITMPITYETGWDMDALRYATCDLDYYIRFDGGDKCGGRIRFQFSNTFSGIIAENLIDTGDDFKTFNGGSIEITPAGNMIMTEGPHNPFDFTAESFSASFELYKITFTPTDHKIQAKYVNINTNSFPTQETSESGKCWGVLSDGKTGLLSVATGSYLPLAGGDMAGTIGTKAETTMNLAEGGSSLIFDANLASGSGGSKLTLQGFDAGSEWSIKSGRGSYLHSATIDSKKKLLFGTYGTSSDPEVVISNAEQILINKTIDCTKGSGTGNTVINIRPENFVKYDPTTMTGKVLAIGADGQPTWAGAGTGNYPDLMNRPAITVGSDTLTIDGTHAITYYGAIDADTTATLKNKTLDCATSGTGAGNNVISNLPVTALASQATTEVGKCVGVKSDGTIGYINPSLIGNVAVIESTLTYAGVTDGYTGTLTADQINTMKTTPCVLRCHLTVGTGTFDVNIGSMSYWKSLSGDDNHYSFDCVVRTGYATVDNFKTYRGYVKILADGTGSIKLVDYGETHRYSIIYLTEDATTHVWSTTVANIDLWDEYIYGNKSVLFILGSDIRTDNRMSVYEYAISTSTRTISFDCFNDVSGTRTYYHGTAVLSADEGYITYTLTPYHPALDSYPVGSIFMSSAVDPQVDPATAFGGEWVEVTTTLGNVLMYRRTA